MKILFLTATYYPSTNGVAINVKATADLLRAQGHTVTIAAPKYPKHKERESHVIRYSSFPNTIHDDYPIPLFPLNSKIFKLVSEGGYDIVHAHHPYQIGWFAEKFSQLMKVPFVFTYYTHHEEYADIYIKFIPKKLRTTIVKLGTEFVFKDADLVITLSDFLGRKLKHTYPQTPIQVIPIGVAFPKAAAKKSSHYHNKKVSLLTFSRLAKEKNIELTLESLPFLPDNFHLTIAGMGPHEKVLKDLAKNLGVTKKVTFLGKVDHDAIPALCRMADIFLFPSVTETQGLNLLEAMYLGLPAVATESEASKDWLPPECGIITQNDPQKFSQAIIKLNSQRGAKKSEATTKWASHFTLERTTNMLLKQYQQLINRSKKLQ